MADRRELIREVIESIEVTTGLFYQQNIREGYNKLEQTLNNLSLLTNLINIDDASEEDTLLANQFNDILKEALQALEQGDTILFSDILQYDLKELLEQEL